MGGYDHTAGNGQVSFCIRNVYYLRTIPHSVELAIMMCKRSIRIIALVLTLLVSGAAVLSWDVAYEPQITDSFLGPQIHSTPSRVLAPSLRSSRNARQASECPQMRINQAVAPGLSGSLCYNSQLG